MPFPSHVPTPILRRRVEAMTVYGVPMAEIAAVIGIGEKARRRHYKSELALGRTKANAKVAENLFRKATGDGREAVVAAIFWLKVRARWKETTVHEHVGVPNEPIEIDFTGMSVSQAAEAYRRLVEISTAPELLPALKKK